MSFGTLTANIGDLWFPAVDDVVCVLHSGAGLLVLVLDHEEVIMLSCLDPGGDTGGLRRAVQASLPGPGPAQEQHVAIELHSARHTGRGSVRGALAPGRITVEDFTETFQAPWDTGMSPATAAAGSRRSRYSTPARTRPPAS
jgi:hypothetical protein